MTEKLYSYLNSLNLNEYLPFVEDVTYLLFFLILLIFLIVFLLIFLLKKGLSQKVNSSQERKKPVLDDIIDKEQIKINDENDFVDVLVAIEEEMNAVRELYVGGYISKGVYISETDRLYEKAKIFGL